MAEFGEQELGLLRALGERDAPSAEDAERVARRLEVELGVALGAGTLVAGALTTAGSASTAAGTASLTASVASSATAGATTVLVGGASAPAALFGGAVMKGLAAATVMTLAVGGVVVSRRGVVPESERSATVVEERAEAEKGHAREASTLEGEGRDPSDPEPEEAERVEETRRDEFSRDVATVKPRSSPAPARSGKNLDAELPLLAEAQRALASGRPSEALVALERHRATFPAGALVVERTGLIAIALCQSGKRGEGVRRATAFLERHGSTPLAARVRKACLP